VPTRLLLEGPDITELLARVRAEHGEAARIVKAEKVRLGGFAGFFAKVRYEVVLELSDDALAAAAAAAAAPAPVAVADPTVTATPVAAVSVTPASAGPASATSLAVPAAPPIPSALPVPAPTSLEELAALADSADTAEVASEPAGRELVPARAPGRALSTESDEFAAVLSRLTDGLGGGIDFDSLPPAPIEPPAEFRPLYGPTSPSADVPEPVEARRSVPVTAPPVTPPPVTPPPALPAGPFEELRRLGVPGHLAASVNGEDLHADLVRVFATIATAPSLPRRPGDVLVLVGDVASALPVARALSKKMRLDPAKLLLAAPSTTGTGITAARRVTGPADAERRARRMHRADVAHVVVIDAPLDGESAEWAKDIADSLGATQVWAVVDATRKVGDLADHLAGLGPVDALVIERADVTRDPASVLDLRVPVALLEGRSATPRAWADLISGRMEAAAQARTSGRRGRRS
jgi:hypothetical protein